MKTEQNVSYAWSVSKTVRKALYKWFLMIVMTKNRYVWRWLHCETDWTNTSVLPGDPSIPKRVSWMRRLHGRNRRSRTVWTSGGLDQLSGKTQDPLTVPKGRVPSSQFIFVRENDNKIVGMIDIRHTLNEYLETYGGHIGYSVAPGEHRRGYVSQMLKEALIKCRGIR